MGARLDSLGPRPDIRTVRERRRAMALSVEELGAASGVDFSKIARHEGGEESLSRADMEDVLDLLEREEAHLSRFRASQRASKKRKPSKPGAKPEGEWLPSIDLRTVIGEGGHV